MFRQDIVSFPPQKKSTSFKYKNDKQWFKENIDACENQAIYYEREEHRKMQVYYDLDNDIINHEEIEKVFNPLGLDINSFPTNIKNYPLSVPKIDLLQGEESKRRFDWTIRARNMDSESSDTTQLMDMLMEITIDELTNKSSSEEDAQKRIQEFSKYAKYSWKDTNEITATKILQYLWRQQDLQYKFNKGFRDATLAAREIYRIDIEGDEPIANASDPRDVYIIRKGKSEKIEDSEAIVEITYEPVNKIVDTFYDFLKPSEIDQLESGTYASTGLNKSNNGLLNYNNKYPSIYSNLDFGNGPGFVDINDMEDQNYSIGLPYDAEGNIRIVRARWVGRKKIGLLSYYDENGDEQEKIVSEYYKLNADLGETIKWLWVNEAYEGTKIGYDIYVKLQPREVQLRHFDNKSKCFLGYVGSDYGKSLMSRMEPYQYAYNIYMSKLEMVMAKYKGPIYELDLNKVPDDWKVEEWLYYADVLGWAVLDNFNEGKKGAATGKLSGSVNQGGSKVMDSNIGNYIQQIVMMLQYIEGQMGEISGVTKQRQGQVENRETVGGVERAVTQSSLITEKWFFLHDETKKRVMNALLDTAKQCWKKNKSKKLNFVLDDLSRQFLEFNGEDISSTEFDLFTTTSRKDMEIRDTLKQLAHAAAQNGQSLGLVIDVLRSDSITEMSRLIETSEEETMRRQEQMQKETNISNEKVAQLAEQSKQIDRELKIYEIDKKAEVEYAKIGVQAEQANAPEDNSIDERKQSLAEKKVSEDSGFKNQQLNEQVRHNKETESIAKSKPKTTSK